MCRILDCHLLEQAGGGIHGGLPQLLGVHLTQTFVSLGVDVLVFHSVGILVDECLALLLGVAVLAHLVLERALVERRGGDVEVSLLDDPRHETIEECHNQCVDVGTIDVGIGHDDDLVVTQFLGVRLLAVLAVHAEAHADALDDVHHRLSFEYLVPLYFLHVQNLTAQRQDGLVEAVAALLGGTAGGVSLDEEYLALLRVLDGTVSELSGKTAACHEVLALHTLACLACCDTCRSCQHHLLANLLCLVGMLFQIVGKCLVHGLLNGSLHLAVAELGLGLSLELWLCHLDGDDGGETLAEVFRGNLDLGFLYLLGNSRLCLCVGFQCAGQRHAETCQVSTALDGVDVVDV